MRGKINRTSMHSLVYTKKGCEPTITYTGRGGGPSKPSFKKKNCVNVNYLFNLYHVLEPLNDNKNKS